jgi:hypothetical protein
MDPRAVRSTLFLKFMYNQQLNPMCNVHTPSCTPVPRPAGQSASGLGETDDSLAPSGQPVEDDTKFMDMP